MYKRQTSLTAKVSKSNYLVNTPADVNVTVTPVSYTHLEAARIDGAGEFYTFNHIVLPIMKPALAVQAIFSFVSRDVYKRQPLRRR